MIDTMDQSEQQRSDYSISAFYDPMTKARFISIPVRRPIRAMFSIRLHGTPLRSE